MSDHDEEVKRVVFCGNCRHKQALRAYWPYCSKFCYQEGRKNGR